MSSSALPTAAELLAEVPASVVESLALPPRQTHVPVFNYHEMDTDTLRGILKVTASVHPEAEVIGKELRMRNAVSARRTLRECSSVQSWLTPRLEHDRAELEALLEQDDIDRQNLCSSGMTFVILEAQTRTNYEEALKLIVDEIDARVIESSPNEAHERAVSPPVYEEEDEAEEAERQKLIAEGKCADCERPKCEDRHGQCLNCLDDQEDYEEKEARREARDFYYVLGLRHSRHTGEPC